MSDQITAEEYRHLIGSTDVAGSMSAEEYQRLLAGVEEPKRTKYGNVKTTVDGIVFDSMAEAKRYDDLKKLEAAGVISELVLQPRFPLMVNGELVGAYRADFKYVDQEGRLVVEDVKGGQATKTEAYRLRKRLMKAVHGIEIEEVSR